MKGYNYNSGTFIGKGGVEIFFQNWIVEKPKGILVLTHGMGEHSGRYGNIINKLTGGNICVYAYDLRGHGKSGGKRGHIFSFMDYINDLKIFIDLIKNEFADVPIIMLGHSLGGLVTIKYALLYPKDMAGLILSSPFLILSMDVPSWKKAMGKFLSKIIPSLTLETGLNPGDLSHDNDAVESYENDPMVHDRASSRWFTEIIKTQEECLRLAPELYQPLLIFHGKEDRIVDFNGSRILHEKSTSKNKELLILDGLYHETMNETETERNRILDVISKWILKSLIPGKAANKKSLPQRHRVTEKRRK